MNHEALANFDHEERIHEFKRDLRKLMPRVVIQKHITTGVPAALNVDSYFQLRDQVSAKFGVHPTSVVVVGSCRTGFSLKLKGPQNSQNRYAIVQPGSDVDVAVVSASLFDNYWDLVFDLVRTQRTWAMDKGKKFVRDLFSGWITPTELPPLPRFEQAKIWAEFFNEVTRSRLCGIRRVSARLYRTWSRLEQYQEILVGDCKRELEKDGDA